MNMTGDRDDTLLIADWQGKLYRVPRAVLAQYEVETAEGLGGHDADAEASPLLKAALEQARAERQRSQRGHPPGNQGQP